MARKDLVRNRLTPEQESAVLWILETFGGWRDTQKLASELGTTPTALVAFSRTHRAKSAKAHAPANAMELMRKHSAQFLEDLARPSAYGKEVTPEDLLGPQRLEITEPLSPEQISLFNDHKQVRNDQRTKSGSSKKG